MWEYISPRDQYAVVDDHILEESVTKVAWIVLGSVSREPIVNSGPPPFSVFELRADDLPFLGELSIPPAQGARGRRSNLTVLP